MTSALNDVIGGSEKRRATEGENDGIGVQWSQARVGQKWQIKVERWPDKLCGDNDTDEHTDDAPDDHHNRELANDLVVIGSCCVQRTTPVFDFEIV